MFGWTPGQWLDREWKENTLPGFDVSPRELAQTLGTEWARDTVDPDFWVKLMWYRVVDGGCEHERVVISDVRFPNEATWIRDHGGYVLDVTRDLDAKVVAHSSEDQLDFTLIDYKLGNTGGVLQLENEAVALVDDLLKL